MLKRGNEVGITTIKTEEKQGCDSLKDIHYHINELTFKYQQKYIDKYTAKEVIDKYDGFINELNELKIPSGAETKKNEIISQLKTNKGILTDYMNTVEIDETDIPKIQKMIQFQVASYIKDKNDFNINKATTYLEDMNWLTTRFINNPKCINGLNTNTYYKMNREIVQWILGKYSFI